MVFAIEIVYNKEELCITFISIVTKARTFGGKTCNHLAEQVDSVVCYTPWAFSRDLFSLEGVTGYVR